LDWQVVDSVTAALWVEALVDGCVQFKRHRRRVSLHPPSFEVDGTHDEIEGLYRQTIEKSKWAMDNGRGTDVGTLLTFIVGDSELKKFDTPLVILEQWVHTIAGGLDNVRIGVFRFYVNLPAILKLYATNLI
jgi:hypothetical protein